MPDAAYRETPRLLLRPPRPDDAGAIFARYAGDPEVTRYLGWPRHLSVEDTNAFIGFSRADWARSAGGPLLIFSRRTGSLLGSSGLLFEAPHRAMTGYVFAHDAWETVTLPKRWRRW